MDQQTVLVTTDETPQDETRHPWTCTWRNTVTRGICGAKNLARDSHCQACGKPYVEQERPRMDPGMGLTVSQSIAERVRRYETVLSPRVDALFAELLSIEEEMGIMFACQSGRNEVKSISLHSTRQGHGFDFGSLDEVKRYAEQQIWWELYEQSGIPKVVSNKRAKEILSDLDKGDLSPLTEEAVRAWIENAVGSLDTLQREKVEEVFDWLRPWRGTYKTNDVFVIGKKVVVENVLEKAGVYYKWRPRLDVPHSAHTTSPRQMLRSLESVFRSLDGKGYALPNSGSELEKAIESADPDNAKFETEYFAGKSCRNGNLHLEFRRPDLVAKLNAIAGGKNLRGERKGRAA